MKPSIYGIAVLMVVLMIVPSANAQWLDGWDHCINLTMDHDAVQSDQTNFPVTAFLNCSVINCTATQANGEDSRIVNAGCGAGGEVIDYEIDFWNTTGVIPVTFNVSSLSSTSDTLYSFYHGNSSVSDAQNPSGVWDSNFVSRYDMHGEGTVLEDSVNNNNLTRQAADDPEILTGQIGMATNYDGGSPTNGATNSSGGPWPQPGDSMTYEMYVYANAISQYDRFFARAGDGTAGTILAVDSGGIINYIVDDGSGIYRKTSSYTLSATTWTYLAATRESTTYLIYGNGVSQSTAAGSNWFVNANNATSIGAQITSHTAFDGMIDEFRVSKTARSAAWINTTYYSLSNNLITYGALQSESAGGSSFDAVSITLNQPTDSSTNGSRTIYHSFTVDLIDSSLFGCWLKTPEGETFNTTSVSNGSATFITEVYGSDGSKSWTVTCQNESTNITATNYTFTIDVGTPYMIAYDDHNITTIPSEDGILSILYADVNNDYIREYLWAPVTDTNGNKDVYITTPAGVDTKVWDNGVDSNFNEYMQFFRTDIEYDGTWDVLFGADIIGANHVFLEINDSNDVVQSSELDTSGASGSDHPKPIVADDWITGDGGSEEYISGFCNSGEIVCMDGNWTSGFSASQIGDYSNTAEDFMGEDVDSDGKLEVFVAEGWTSGDATVTINIHTLFIDTDCSIATDKTALTNTSYSQAYFCDGIVDIDGDGNDELVINWQNDVTNYLDIIAYEYNSSGDLEYDFTIGDRISNIEHISWNSWCGDHDLDGDNEMIFPTRSVADGLTLTVRMYDCPSGSCTTTTLYSGKAHSIYDAYGRSPYMRYGNEHPSGTFAMSGFLDDWVAWKINYTLPFINKTHANDIDSINITYTAFDYGSNTSELTVYRDFYCNYTLIYSDSLIASNATEYTWNILSSNISSGDICWGRFAVDDGYANSTAHNSTSVTILGSLPYIDSVEEPTDPSKFVYGTSYYFNTTACDNNGASDIDTVTLDWNGTNETVTANATVNSSCEEFYVIKSGLSTGVIDYVWYVNDTSGSMVSGSGSWTLNKGDLNLTLYLNGTQADKWYNNNTQANITLYANVSDATINITTNSSSWTADQTATAASLEYEYTTSCSDGEYINVTGYLAQGDNYTTGNISHHIKCDLSAPAFSSYSDLYGGTASWTGASQTHTFYVTVADAYVGTVSAVYMEWGGTNYSASASGSRYSWTTTGLDEGSYTYRWWSNDSLSNDGYSTTQSYSVVPGEQGGGGSSYPTISCGSYMTYPPNALSGYASPNEIIPTMELEIINGETTQFYTAVLSDELYPYCEIIEFPTEKTYPNGLALFKIRCIAPEVQVLGSIVFSTDTGCEDSKMVTIYPLDGVWEEATALLFEGVTRKPMSEGEDIDWIVFYIFIASVIAICVMGLIYLMKRT